IAGVYYTDYEPLKRATNDVNGDGKINIADDWHVNSFIDGMKSMSWVQDVVQKQTEAIGDGAQPYDPMNNNTIGPLRAAYFVKQGPICRINFQDEVSSQYVNNVFKVFKTIDSDLQPWLPKFFPIKTSFTSFAGMMQINGNDTPDVVMNYGSRFYPMDLCDFSGSYIIDPLPQESNQNDITSNGQPISHIDCIIMQHDTLPSVPIPPSVFPQYTVTEVSRDQLLALAYTPYDLDAFKIYIIDDTVNKLVMFNMHLRQKGFIDTKQYVLSMSQSIDPKKTLLFPVMILYDFNTDPIQDIPSAYLTVADTNNPARWHIHISSQLKADNIQRCLFFVNEMAGIFHKIKQIAQKIIEETNWANQHIYKPIKPFVNALAPPIISKGLQAASSGLDVIYANNAQDRIMNLANFRNDVENFIDEPSVRQSIENNRYIRLNPNVSRYINRTIGTHLAIPSNQTVSGTQNSVQEVGEEDF
ncbi:MAG: hypothetical protein EZS28_032945, partial [Streblomastix strix]